MTKRKLSVGFQDGKIDVEDPDVYKNRPRQALTPQNHIFDCASCGKFGYDDLSNSTSILCVVRLELFHFNNPELAPIAIHLHKRCVLSYLEENVGIGLIWPRDRNI